MYKLIFSFVTFLFYYSLHAQNNLQQTASAILEEGKQLYQTEMASWYGTDIFLDRFKDQTKNIGGYFSYLDGRVAKCIFFSNDATPKILATISFDSTYNVQTALVEGAGTFTPLEQELYEIRKKALEDVQKDSLYLTYNNTSLNLIPYINGEDKKVYVLTGPKSHGTVVFGNDYLLTFDKQNNLVNRRKLHKSIIPIDYSKNGTDVIGSIHSHLPGMEEYMTATDVCTLMLYGKFAKWKHHMVVSQNYVSIFDCETAQLLILTKDAWEKINKDKKKRNH